MKKIINILSVLGIFISPIAIGIVYSKDSSKIQAETIVTLEKATEDFPLQQTRFIDFKIDENSFELLSERQQQNQLRDWLLFTIVSSQKSSTDTINLNLNNLPTFRYGDGKALSNLQYGKTRSSHLGNGKIVALLPKDISEQERTVYLSKIADQYRQYLNQNSASLTVFEYEIERTKQFALVTKHEIFEETKEFFREGQYGYHSSQINNLDDLARFLNQVDYLTFAKFEGRSVTLGGRKLSRYNFPRITLDDVATLWQSKQQLQNPGNGFSLEASYDYRSLEQFLNSREQLFQSLTLGQSPAITLQEIQNAKNNLAQNNEIPYLSLANKLTRNNDPKIAKYGEIAMAEAMKHRFQIARYGGNLEGTEVAMVLFYTDMVAKLLAIDYLSNPSEGQVSDFNFVKNLQVASRYSQPIDDVSNIRLAFSFDSQTFHTEEDKNSPTDRDKLLLFAPNVTRIHAVSYNPLEGNANKTTSADADAFLGWWNDNYKEVLINDEPQYEKLDELIKWSQLITWLKDSKSSPNLSFLKEVEVKRNRWFPDWVKSNSSQLKFPISNYVRFYPRGYKETTTEAMASLGSETSELFGQKKFISGEVLLAKRGGRGRSRGGSRKSPKTPKSDPNYHHTTPNPDVPNTTPNTTPSNKHPINLPSNSNPVKPIGKARENVNFPGVRANPYVNKITSTSTSIRQISTSIDNINLGLLNIKRSVNGFVVGWKGQGNIQEQSLVQQLNADIDNTGDLEVALSKNPNLEALVIVPENPPSYLVKMNNSNRWLKVSPESSTTPKTGGKQYKIGNTQNITLTPIDAQTVSKQIKKEGAKPIIYDRKTLEFASLTDDFNHGRYDEVALKLVKNPQKLQDFYNHKLKQTDQWIQSKDYGAAAHNIDELINVYGKRPGLMLRKAVVDIGRNRLQVELRESSDSGIGKDQSGKDFLDEINTRLGNSNDKVQFVEHDDRYSFYVQDNPGLNQSDPNLPTESSTPLNSTTKKVYELLPGEIGDVKLGISGFQETTPSSDSNISSRSDTRVRVRSRNNNYQDECDNEQNSQSECHTEQDIAEDGQKPIYIVIESNNA